MDAPFAELRTTHKCYAYCYEDENDINLTTQDTVSPTDSSFRSIEPATLAKFLSTDRNWNEEYQSLIEKTCSSPHSELERVQQIQSLYETFCITATTIAVTIISELFLKEKTIQPITEQVGGVAGGLKYLHQGIFFKFAVDEYGLYRDDEGIMKAAGHELRSLMWCMDQRVQGLHFPLCSLVDFRGRRVIALSLLPISNRTLIYGSTDAGKTIYNESQDFAERIELLASQLNLNSFYVKSKQDQRVRLFSPVDAEGHQGRDGRQYVVDVARYFPPEYRGRLIEQNRTRGSFLFRLLRPEFLQKYQHPLCPDAVSGFQIENKKQLKQQVIDASTYLWETVVPMVGNKLHSLLDTSNATDSLFETLITEVHRQGLNIRFLGNLCTITESKRVKQLLFTEIVARTAKQLMRRRMRTLQSTNVFEFKKIVVQSFNLLFLCLSKRDNDVLKQESFLHWEEVILPEIRTRFGICWPHNDTTTQTPLSPEKILPYCFKQTLSYALFRRLQTITGVRLVDPSQGQSRETNPWNPQFDSWWTFDHPALSIVDVLEMGPTVKQIHKISFDEGHALSKLASSSDGDSEAVDDLRSSTDYLARAQTKYSEALQRNPADARALHNWGLLLYMRARNSRNPEHAEEFYRQSEAKFRKAVSTNPNDPKWANGLAHRAELLLPSLGPEDTRLRRERLLAKAVRKFHRAAKKSPEDFRVFFNWANALYKQSGYATSKEQSLKLLKSASKKHQKAHKLEPLSHQVLRNWGVTLSKRESGGPGGDRWFRRSISKYSKAVKLSPRDHEIYYNWGNALYHYASSMDSTSSPEAISTLLDSCGRYRRAVELCIENKAALTNWGKALTLLDSLGPEASQAEALGREVYLYIHWYMLGTKGIEGSFLNLLQLLASFRTQSVQSIYQNWMGTPAQAGSMESPPAARSMQPGRANEHNRNSRITESLVIPRTASAGKHRSFTTGANLQPPQVLGRNRSVSDPEYVDLQRTLVLPNVEAVDWRGETILSPTSQLKFVCNVDEPQID